jgi:hypothetical protein
MELFSLLATLRLTCVVCLLVLCVGVEGGVPLYLYRARGGVRSYIWREACTPPPLHVEEAPPQQGEAGRRPEGSGRPLGAANP